jgi:hypothetical protein
MKLDKKFLFIKYYCGGISVTVNAMAADGITLSRSQATRYMKSPYVIDAIKDKTELTVEQSAGIATKARRQIFWTDVMLNEKVKMNERLKASELLGRCQMDFTERVKVEGGDAPVKHSVSSLEVADRINQLKDDHGKK